MATLTAWGPAPHGRVAAALRLRHAANGEVVEAAGASMKLHFLSVIVLAVALLGAPAKGATLVVEGRALVGATGVQVDDMLYDVTFADGTCIALFDGCNQVADLTFRTESAALLAANALLDQVLLGNFDVRPSLARGCNDSGACRIAVPYGLSSRSVIFSSIPTALVAQANNLDDGTFTSGIDSVSVGSVDRDEDLGEDFFEAFAVFTEAAEVTVVPLPPAGWLLLGGLAALGALGRRRA
ncbi:MAG: hypothetical protein AAF675_12815 [Pseudomonadota bacterium]